MRQRFMPIRATFILLSMLLVGCEPPASARFEVSGVADGYTDCFDVAFPFVPIFHAYRERANSSGIFFQSRGGNFQFVDVVYFEVFDVETLPLGTPIPTSPFVNTETRVAASVALEETCPTIGILGTTTPGAPQLPTVPLIEGAITFDAFSRVQDGLIEGSIEGSLVSPVGAVIAETFSGEFSFTVQVGQPYEEFRN